MSIKVIGKISEEVLGMQQRPKIKCSNCGKPATFCLSRIADDESLCCSVKCRDQYNAEYNDIDITDQFSDSDVLGAEFMYFD